MKTTHYLPNTSKLGIHTCLLQQVFVELPRVIESSALQNVVGLVFALSSKVDVGVIRRLLLLLFDLLFRRLGLGLLVTVGDAWPGSG